VQTPTVLSDRTSAWAQYTIQVDERASVERSLREAGIPTAVHYPMPLHRQPVYADMGLPLGTFPHAERAAARVLSLPMHPWLQPAQIEQICEGVKAAVGSPITR
jgi:UDP-2-acetamido-2-deoxy-ribo-hexuluronate aminotransferase